MDGIIAIAAYRPKPGKSEALRQLMREHLPTLHRLGLVTDRASIMMESKDGTIVEVFEWRSKSAIEQAHTNPAVLEMWGKYAEACDYIPVGQVPEAADLFSSFTPFR
jgi:quinol monooxygenase YgiN